MEVSKETYRARIRRGWSEERARTEPVRTMSAHDKGWKLCLGCMVEKPLSDFYRLGRRKGTEYAPRCKSCSKVLAKMRDQELRIRVLEAYSHGRMECAQCGETRVGCLDIDHVNNDGADSRKQSKSSYNLFRKLERGGWPDGYQVLCRNCNWLKHLAHLEEKNGSI